MDSDKRLQNAHNSGAVRVNDSYTRAINAGASDALALRCGGSTDSSHGQRRTFGQRKPDHTSDAQAKIRNVVNAVVRKVDQNRATESAVREAITNPTRKNKRYARAAMKFAARHA